MVTWFLFLPAVALFMVINIVIGCFVVIRLGYGPPNWQTALNQVVRLTMLQDYLNTMREWLEKKAPKVDQFLSRVHVPKPIIIVDTTPEEIEEEAEEEKVEAEEESDEDVPEAIASVPVEAESETN